MFNFINFVMKKRHLSILFVVVTFPHFLFSQVGINTVSPNSQLEIKSSNQATPANTDGILIPKVDEFPTTNPGSSQDGMMLFMTGDGAPAKGFYYWNNASSSWLLIVGANGATLSINDLNDGKSDNDGSENGSSIYLGVEAGAADLGNDNQNIGFGYHSLKNNDTGYTNVGLGYQSLFLNTSGYFNLGIGATALGSNKANRRSLAIGHGAMLYADDRVLDARSTFNTAIGIEALYGSTTASNNTGRYNTALGFQTLYNNTSGGSNNVIGFKSLYDNTSGSRNTALGNNTLSTNQANIGSTAIGHEALRYADDRTTGRITYNTAVGYAALRGNETTPSGNTGRYNNALGHQSLLRNTTGSSNSANGAYTLINNSIGNNNTALGRSSLYSNTEGNNNVSVGKNSLYNNISNNGSVAIGTNAMQYADNRSTGRVTGNTAVGFKALRGSTTPVDNTGQYNTSIGSHSLINNTSGNNNTANGYLALNENTTGNQNTALGSSAFSTGTAYTNSTAIGYDAEPGASNTIRLGNASVATIGGYQDWTNVSDARFKTNIKESVIGLDFIKKLRPVTYQLDMDAIAEFHKTPDSLRLPKSERLKAALIQSGFIAQEVEKVVQGLGYEFSGVDKPKNKTAHYGLRYATFVVPLVKGMQEQQLQIESLKKENNDLKKRIAKIEKILFNK